MKRILIIAFSLTLLLSLSSLATNTRVKTMGDNNTILLDEANIWQFPSRINDYPDIVIGEFGSFSPEYFSGEYGSTDDFTELGIHWKFNEDRPWILGTYLHNSDVVSPMSSPFRSYYGSPYGYNYQFVPFDWSLMSNQRIDLLYGREWMGNPFGFRFSLVHSSQKNQEPLDKGEEMFRIFQFVAGWTLTVPQIDVAAGLELMSWTDKGTDLTVSPASAYDQSKPKGNYALWVEGRRFITVIPYTVIPHAKILYAKNEAEYYSSPPSPIVVQTDKYTRFGIDVGCGLEYATGNALAVMDFGLKYNKLDGDFTDTTAYDASIKTITIPYFKAGVDVKVFNWMDLRLGATSYWDKRTRENDFKLFPDKLVQNYSNNATYLGFGFHWGDLHVDTYTDPELFFNGFNFISGQTSNMNFQITALYEMM